MLFLRVAPSGRKRWYYTYQRPSEIVRGRGAHYPRATIAGDLFPTMGLAAARRWAEGIRSQVLLGRDPQPARVAQQTLSELVEEYGRRVGHRARTWHQLETALRSGVLTWRGEGMGAPLGDLPAAAVDTPTLVDCFDAIAERAPSTANKTQAALSPIFRWALRRGKIAANPLAGVPRTSPPRSRDRVLDDEEVVAFWRIATALEPTRASWGLRLVLATGQRPGEVLTFEPGELEWEHVANLPDGSRWTGAVWIIPRSKHKTGRRLIAAGKADQARDHVVPLSSLAANLFRGALERRLSDRFPLLMAPPPKDYNPTFHRVADLAVFRREMAHWNPQDLRRTAYTGMRALGIPRDHVEAVVGHAIPGVAGVYDRYGMLREKARALEAWGRHLEQRVTGRTADVVRIG